MEHLALFTRILDTKYRALSLTSCSQVRQISTREAPWSTSPSSPEYWIPSIVPSPLLAVHR